MLQNRGIRTKLVLMAGVPLLAFAYLLVSIVHRDVGVAREMSTLQTLVAFTTDVSRLVHELQRERGNSSGFLSSHGTAVRNELAAQRVETDKRMAALGDRLARLDAAAISPEFATQLQTVLKKLDGLKAQRAAIDAQNLPVADGIGYYTDLIGGFLDLVTDASKQVDDGEIATRLLAYLNLMRGKEQAGIERATLTALFTADAIPEGFLLRAASVSTGQAQYLAAFQAYATPAERQLFAAKVQGKDVDDVTRLRDLLYKRATEPSLGKIDPTAWFNAATARIDLLKVVEDGVASDLLGRAQDLEKSTWRSLYTDLGLSLVLLVMTLALGQAITRTIVMNTREVQRGLSALADDCATWLADALDALARGDLTARPAPVIAPIVARGSDELGQMAVSANVLHDRLNATMASYEEARAGLAATVLQIRHSADGVADNGHQLGRAAQNTSKAAVQVAQSVQSMAAGTQETSRSAQTGSHSVTQLSAAIDGIATRATEQLRQVRDIAGTTSRMAASVDQVSASAHAVAVSSDQTRASIAHGDAAVRQIAEAMLEIEQVAGQAASNVGRLGQLGERIGAVVETIDDIAEQTNLLALNAAIEAARAGELGKGFAVVADEVRKLAERSQRETKAIAQLIREIQDGTQAAVNAMSAGTEKIELGTARAAQAEAALVKILGSVESAVSSIADIAQAAEHLDTGARSVARAMEEISDVVEENTGATQEMASHTTQVTDAIESIAAVAEENSAVTQEVSAAAEQMSAQSEEVSAQAQELAVTAELLRQMVARFKLDGAEPRPGDGSRSQTRGAPAHAPARASAA